LEFGIRNAECGILEDRGIGIRNGEWGMRNFGRQRPLEFGIRNAECGILEDRGIGIRNGECGMRNFGSQKIEDTLKVGAAFSRDNKEK